MNNVIALFSTEAAAPAAKRERTAPKTVCGFRWKARQQRFERASVYFDPKTQEAYSYSWWRFVERIGPYLVFNNYSYSVSTSKHQRQMRWLLSDLGLSIDLNIEAPQGLADLESAIAHYNRRILALETACAKKGARKAKNAERLQEIDQLKIKIATIQMLQTLKAKQAQKA